ncbi:DAK2 domain-containing protein [Streptomyces sp. NPDC059896]|uniref:DAK2 domain-containing protein n=1 Tax=Streptomyces sp. NPDC059896 TaxID=3346993 RepID=UPI00366141E5
MRARWAAVGRPAARPRRWTPSAARWPCACAPPSPRSPRPGRGRGALWGVLLHAVGDALGDTAAPTAGTVADGVSGASAAVRRLGGAETGDKTMVDVLVPFADTLAGAVADGTADTLAGAVADGTADTLTGAVADGATLTAAWDRAATAAEEAAKATAGLVPRVGRARPHAERSLGTPDAGAHSLALIVRAVHGVLAAH